MFYFHVRATIHIIAKVFIFLTSLTSPVYRQAETMTLITMEGYDYWFKILLLGDTGLLFIMDFLSPINYLTLYANQILGYFCSDCNLGVCRAKLGVLVFQYLTSFSVENAFYYFCDSWNIIESQEFHFFQHNSCRDTEKCRYFLRQ